MLPSTSRVVALASGILESQPCVQQRVFLHCCADYDFLFFLRVEILLLSILLITDSTDISTTISNIIRIIAGDADDSDDDDDDENDDDDDDDDVDDDERLLLVLAGV